jgi:hypothetical protein
MITSFYGPLALPLDDVVAPADIALVSVVVYCRCLLPLPTTGVHGGRDAGAATHATRASPTMGPPARLARRERAVNAP